jgi:GDPmannose 4,6-dehydratase
VKNKTALITGINGMDGSHLADLLLTKGYKVYGMERRVSTPVRRNSAHLVGKITFITGDLTDSKSLINAIEVSQPDEVYNLAAQSFVGSSWTIPNQTSEVNAIGVLNLLEAIRQVKPDTKFYQASTSEMYGNHFNTLANEETVFTPRSPYGVAKLYAHHMTLNYRESYGLFASCGILFNHESERRGIEFVTRKITDGVAQIWTGKTDKLTLGSLSAKRDWGYAPDYVEAMWKMLQLDEPDEFVIATGKNYSVEDFVRLSFLHVGIEDWQKYVVQDERFTRPAEIYSLRGDPTKAKNTLSWKPACSFEHMIGKMVDNDLDIHNG